MLRKLLILIALVTVGLGATGYALYLGNGAPASSPISPVETASGKPFVVKLHAQWCPVCLVTKDVWSDIAEAYADRVNLVVMDFTNDATTAASWAEARRLGFGESFDEYGGASGFIVVLDGRTREVTSAIGGSRDVGEYRTAIDDALKSAGR